MVRQLSCDVGGARYAIVYIVFIECTYISYMRDGDSYKSNQFDYDNDYKLLLELRFLSFLV